MKPTRRQAIIGTVAAGVAACLPVAAAKFRWHFEHFTITTFTDKTAVVVGGDGKQWTQNGSEFTDGNSRLQLRHVRGKEWTIEHSSKFIRGESLS